MAAPPPTSSPGAGDAWRHLAQVLDDAVEDLTWSAPEPAPELQDALSDTLVRLTSRLATLQDRSTELVGS